MAKSNSTVAPKVKLTQEDLDRIGSDIDGVASRTIFPRGASAAPAPVSAPC